MTSIETILYGFCCSLISFAVGFYLGNKGYVKSYRRGYDKGRDDERAFANMCRAVKKDVS